MVNVLHLCAGNLYGGIERIVAECAADRRLAPGMRPGFATFFDGRLASELDAIGVTCHRLGDVRVSRPHTVVRARRRLADVIAADRPDVALCHSPWTFGLAAPVLRRTAVPSILWAHDRFTGRTWIERWASLTSPDAIISNSQFTAASVATLYPRSHPVVVYAPVPAAAAIAPGERTQLRRSLGVPADETCVVLTASRFERWKGHANLLDAVAQLRGDYRVWMAGGPQKAGELEYEQELRGLCERHGIADRVQFLGERRDVAALMRAADVHCQPNSGPEPFGLAFVEALYASLPVVTTRMGGAVEIVTEQCGVLVPPDDTVALAAALQQLVTDPAARRRLGAAGPARAAELCDPATQLARLGSVVESIAV